MAYGRKPELLSNVKATGRVVDHTYDEYMNTLKELKSAEAHAALRKSIYDTARWAHAKARHELSKLLDEREEANDQS